MFPVSRVFWVLSIAGASVHFFRRKPVALPTNVHWAATIIWYYRAHVHPIFHPYPGFKVNVFVVSGKLNHSTTTRSNASQSIYLSGYSGIGLFQTAVWVIWTHVFCNWRPGQPDSLRRQRWVQCIGSCPILFDQSLIGTHLINCLESLVRNIMNLTWRHYNHKFTNWSIFRQVALSVWKSCQNALTMTNY